MALSLALFSLNVSAQCYTESQQQACPLKAGGKTQEREAECWIGQGDFRTYALIAFYHSLFRMSLFCAS